MSRPAVSIDDLSFSYGTISALDRISFDVPEECVFGLLGPNGSGKTTLFRILATLLPVPSGCVSVCGIDPAMDPTRLRFQLGITFQSPALDLRLTVRENLLCHGRIYGLSKQDILLRVKEFADRFGISDRMNSYCEELSGGLRRRVELAKGLLHRPRLLLLDEPSNGLDPVARSQFWQLIRDEQKQTGMTVVVTTHLMSEAETCDKLALLNAGKVIRQGSPRELCETEAGNVLSLRCSNPDGLQTQLEKHLDAPSMRHHDRLRFRIPNASQALAEVMVEYSSEIISAEVSRQSLEDVFIDLTGRSLSDQEDPQV